MSARIDRAGTAPRIDSAGTAPRIDSAGTAPRIDSPGTAQYFFPKGLYLFEEIMYNRKCRYGYDRIIKILFGAWLQCH